MASIMMLRGQTSFQTRSRFNAQRQTSPILHRPVLKLANLTSGSAGRNASFSPSVMSGGGSGGGRGRFVKVYASGGGGDDGGSGKKGWSPKFSMPSGWGGQQLFTAGFITVLVSTMMYTKYKQQEKQLQQPLHKQTFADKVEKVADKASDKGKAAAGKVEEFKDSATKQATKAKDETAKVVEEKADAMSAKAEKSTNGAKEGAFASLGKALHLTGDSKEEAAKKVEDMDDDKDRKRLYIILGSVGTALAVAGAAAGTTVYIKKNKKFDGGEKAKKSVKETPAKKVEDVKQAAKDVAKEVRPMTKAAEPAKPPIA